MIEAVLEHIAINDEKHKQLTRLYSIGRRQRMGGMAGGGVEQGRKSSRVWVDKCMTYVFL